MTIYLGGLEWAAQLVGARFPDADEDALWRCAQAWHRAAEQLRLVPPVAGEIGSRIAEAVAGETAARFAQLWGPLGSADGPIARLADACDVIAGGCDRAAAEVERAKLRILAELGVLAATVAAFAVPALWLVSGIAIAQAIAAARVAILLVLGRLVQLVGGPMAGLLDLDGLLAQIRTLLGLLAGAALAPTAQGGAGAATQPGLFAPVSSLPNGLPAALGAAGALLLAGLAPTGPNGPQETISAPSGPGTAGGPVPSPGTPVVPAGGGIHRPLPLPLPPPPAPQPPVLPAPSGPPSQPGPPAAPPVGPANPPPVAGTSRQAPSPAAPRPPGPPAPAGGTPPLAPPTGPPTPPASPPAPPGPSSMGSPAPPGPIASGPGVSSVAVAVALPGALAPTAREGAGPRARGGGAEPAEPAAVLTDAEALAFARACLFATDAGYGFYPPGDENRDLARAVRGQPGQVAVDLLGDGECFTIDSGRLPAGQFAAVLRELIATGELTVRSGDSIRLICGAAPAQVAVVAAELGVEVLAPDRPLWTSIGGDAMIATTNLVEGLLVPTDPPDGGWCRFGGARPGPSGASAQSTAAGGYDGRTAS